MITNIYFILTFVLINSSLSCFSQRESDKSVDYDEYLSLNWKKSDNQLYLQAKSKFLAPITISLYSKANNEEIKTLLLKAKDSLVINSMIHSTNDSIHIARFKDSIQMKFFLGHKSLIKENLNYKYRLPFKKGKKYKVLQSFNGNFSHQTIQSKYAIDFALNINEPVFAARDGLVVKAIDWFKESGGEELKEKANKIIILHSDGTMAYYAHLKFNGILVKEGEQVNKGQKIGFSGNTGYSTKPHLHFVVRKERFISIPIFFSGYENEILQKNQKYKVVE